MNELKRAKLHVVTLITHARRTLLDYQDVFLGN